MLRRLGLCLRRQRRREGVCEASGVKGKGCVKQVVWNARAVARRLLSGPMAAPGIAPTPMPSGVCMCVCEAAAGWAHLPRRDDRPGQENVPQAVEARRVLGHLGLALVLLEVVVPCLERVRVVAADVLDRVHLCAWAGGQGSGGGCGAPRYAYGKGRGKEGGGQVRVRTPLRPPWPQPHPR